MIKCLTAINAEIRKCYSDSLFTVDYTIHLKNVRKRAVSNLYPTPKYTYHYSITRPKMSTEENKGYILRVSTDFTLEQIVSLNKYYAGITRNWRRGSPVLLIRKTDKGDAFVAYGVIDKLEMLWEMTPDEEHYARGMGWKVGITFRGLHVFKTPLLFKESPMKTDSRKGSFLHGVVLDETMTDAILEAAEENIRNTLEKNTESLIDDTKDVALGRKS